MWPSRTLHCACPRWPTHPGLQREGRLDRRGGGIVISSTERASARIIGCSAIPSPWSTLGDAIHDASRGHGSDDLDGCSGRHVRQPNDGPDERFVGRFQVVRIGSRRKRAVAAILGGQGPARIADKYAHLYRASTLVALRRGPETYETAALPLSYVGVARV